MWILNLLWILCKEIFEQEGCDCSIFSEYCARRYLTGKDLTVEFLVNVMQGDTWAGRIVKFLMNGRKGCEYWICCEYCARRYLSGKDVTVESLVNVVHGGIGVGRDVNTESVVNIVQGGIWAGRMWIFSEYCARRYFSECCARRYLSRKDVTVKFLMNVAPGGIGLGRDVNIESALNIVQGDIWAGRVWLLNF